MSNLDIELLEQCSNCLKVLSVDMVEEAKSGHPGMPMGMADITTVLFSYFIKFNPSDPKWPNRDRFVLSNGHGSALLYSLLYLLGYADTTMEDLKQFRQLGSQTAGHPEYGSLQGIETTTGPLGQGFANSVGMAIGEKVLKTHLTHEVIDYRIFCYVGDGCISEGITYEAASLASHLELDNLVVIYDANKISIDGPLDLAFSEDIVKRFEACGWQVFEGDGHNFNDIYNILNTALNSNIKKPIFIKMNTVIAQGAPTKSGQATAHGAPLGKEEVLAFKKAIKWENTTPFYIPAQLKEYWHHIGARHLEAHHEWVINNAHIYSKWQQAKEQALKLVESELDKILYSNTENKIAEEPTRASSKAVIDLIAEYPYFIGGSADLSESNCVISSHSKVLKAGNFAGNFIHYGIREHAMAGIMNGLALSGFIPFGGTFLVFSDYMRAAIRLSAIMGLRVIYIMTHDSIGIGEDGPTHQPVEQLPALRLIPNLKVLRPHSRLETIYAWKEALTNKNPSALILTRQKVQYAENLYSNSTEYYNNYNKFGSSLVYQAVPNNISKQLNIFASGSEVSIAVNVAQNLKSQKININVFSVLDLNLLIKMYNQFAYKFSLQNDAANIAIEAAIMGTWPAILGIKGRFFGMNSFGTSGKTKDVYRHFHLDAISLTEIIISEVINN